MGGWVKNRDFGTEGPEKQGAREQKNREREQRTENREQKDRDQGPGTWEQKDGGHWILDRGR
jgi:hypothetical protein